jgi:hypothetical protein
MRSYECCCGYVRCPNTMYYETILELKDGVVCACVRVRFCLGKCVLVANLLMPNFDF